MKKRMVLLCLSLTCVLGVTACQSKNTADSAAAPDTAATMDAETETTEVAVAPVPTAETPDKVEDTAFSTNYASTEELFKAAGFMVLELPAYWGDPTAIHMDTNIAAVEYEFAGSGSALVCSAKLPDQDITAGMGIEVDIEEENDAKVHISQSDDKTYYSGWWSDGILSYSVETLNVDEDTFENMIEELTGITSAYPGGVIDNAPESQVANPMAEYYTYEEAEAAAGFKGLYLIGASGYDIDDIYVINNNLLNYDYEGRDDDDRDLTVRTAKGTEDISGFYGVTYTDQQISGVAVHTGTYEDSRIAWWTDGTYAFSVSAEEVSQDTFLSLVESLVETSKTLN